MDSPHRVQLPPLAVHFQEHAVVAVEALARAGFGRARRAALLHGQRRRR